MDFSLKHTSISCAHYRRGDDLGKLLAYWALSPVCLICFQLSKVYARREFHEAVLLIGLVLEEGLARVLKHVLKHPRPPATCGMLKLCHSHGMPSSHTSMMFCYLAITSFLAIMAWRQRTSVSRIVSAFEQLVLAATAAGVGYSRVYLGYHSLDQVLAGAAVGTVFGLLWAVLMHLMHPLYSSLARVQLLQQFGVKDTYGCAEPLQIEQQAHALAKLNCSREWPARQKGKSN